MTYDESERAYQLQKNFDEVHRELQMAMEDGFADPVDVGMLQAQAQETLDRELEELLGKDRFNEMRGVTDPITDVYQTFGALKPTPSQAEAVVQVEEDYRAREADLVDRLSRNPGDAARVTAELKAMNDAREAELRRIFGAEAYNKMKRQNDPTYKRLTQFAEAWELKDHEIPAVYEALSAFHDHADRTRAAAATSEEAGKRVDWHEVDSSIEQARQQTEAGLQDLIGGKRLGRLKQNEMLTIC